MRHGIGHALCAAMLAIAGTGRPALAEPYAFTVVDARAVPAPLGGLRGDAGRGAALAAQHCAACHGDREALGSLMRGTVRLAIIDLSVLDPEAKAHAFYVPDAEGRTALTAQDIEDIVVFLAGERPRRTP
jgi:mono/diheme cytochrome c family protein